jgi:hypothetical protein
MISPSRANVPSGWASEMRWLLLLAVVGCSGCAPVIQSRYQPAILIYPTMPSARAVTKCSLNNVPVILIDSLVWYHPDRELTLEHEMTHSDDAYGYRGGCWSFLNRYNRDKAFRVRVQLKAYCAEGRLAIRRNKNPESMWQYIVAVMAPDTALTARDNCIYAEEAQ